MPSKLYLHPSILPASLPTPWWRQGRSPNGFFTSHSLPCPNPQFHVPVARGPRGLLPLTSFLLSPHTRLLGDPSSPLPLGFSSGFLPLAGVQVNTSPLLREVFLDLPYSRASFCAFSHEPLDSRGRTKAALAVHVFLPAGFRRSPGLSGLSLAVAAVPRAAPDVEVFGGFRNECIRGALGTARGNRAGDGEMWRTVRTWARQNPTDPADWSRSRQSRTRP